MGRKKKKSEPQVEIEHKSEGRTLNPDILHASVRALSWRMEECAARMREAVDAVSRGQSERAVERLFVIEPLIYDAKLIMSAATILVHEHSGTRRIPL